MSKFPLQLGAFIHLTLLYWCTGQLPEKPEEEGRQICPTNNDICYALLMISGGVIIPQEPTAPTFKNYLYCRCKDERNMCNTSDWETEDGKHLTFYHYERVDWQIQFKFCDRIEREKCKETDDVAAVLRTGTKRWTPSLVKYNCRCPDNIYFIMGWRLKKIEPFGDQWEYTFNCDRPQCEEKAECHRHYVKRSELHTIAYDFYCSCPTGWECPLGISPIKSYAKDGEDKELGPYVHGYCQKIPGWGPPAKGDE